MRACMWACLAITASAASAQLDGARVRLDLRTAASTLSTSAQIEPIDGGRHRFVVDRRTSRATGATISGRIEGEERGAFVLTVEAGRVLGGLWTERAAYTLAGSTSVGDLADCEIREIPADEVVRCALANQATPEPWRHLSISSPSARGDARPRAPVVGMTDPGGRAGHASCCCDDDPGVIDVLVVYTALARDNAGGVGPLQVGVQNMIDTSNAVFANSGLDDVSVNLIGFEEIVYDEASPDWIDHLERITDPADGFMDDVHARRDAYAADTVMLIVDDPRFTGGSAWWAIWDEASAFSVLNWRSAGGGILTGAHEFGHNLGCAHDRGNDASAPFSYAWGHKYTASATEYGTVMSIGADVFVPQFSDPGVLGPGGQALGVPIDQPGASHCAFQVEHTAWTLANYRRSARIPDCNNNGVDDATDIANHTSNDENLDGIPDECQAVIRADINATATGSGDTWADPRHDLAEVVDLANLRCNKTKEIWVADGTYPPDHGTADPWQRFDMRTGLALYGGFDGQSRPGGGETTRTQRDWIAHPAILSGDIGAPGDPADNTYSVLVAQDADTTSILDGFTIEDGHSFGDAGGLWMTRSSPSVYNCTFRNNHADFNGGAIIALEGSSPFFGATVFEGNEGGGAGGAAAAYGGSGLTFVRILFKQNTSGFIGGSISVTDGSLRVESASFREGETAEYGGAIDLWNSGALIDNSRFYDNTAGIDGGALTLAGDSTIEVNACTFALNDAAERGGAISFSASDLTLVNSILWDNTDGLNTGQDEQLWIWSGTTGIDRTCIQGWNGALGGTGNTAANPLLIDAASGDFTLAPGSPAIDAGDASRLPADDFDLDADGNFAEALPYDLDLNPRLADDPNTPNTGVGTLDLGAFEYQPPACPADLSPPPNGDGNINTNDFFLFLTYYQARDPRADFSPPDGDGNINTNDFFAFLAAYQQGC